jgi:hypothetical protein
MAESGGISGILGADSESPAEGAPPETALDATAAALAVEAARGDPELALPEAGISIGELSRTT